MKKLLLLLLVVMVCLVKANAQYAIDYEYDDSGNRLHRKIIPLSSLAPKTDEPIPPAIDQLGERIIKVFPNPTKGRLMISISGGKPDESYSITIYKFSGTNIYINKMVGPGDYPIEMGQYENGVYILVLNAEKEKISYKIIKE